VPLLAATGAGWWHPKGFSDRQAPHFATGQPRGARIWQRQGSGITIKCGSLQGGAPSNMYSIGRVGKHTSSLGGPRIRYGCVLSPVQGRTLHYAYQQLWGRCRIIQIDSRGAVAAGYEAGAAGSTLAASEVGWQHPKWQPQGQTP
jgi:hypothetical protein